MADSPNGSTLEFVDQVDCLEALVWASTSEGERVGGVGDCPFQILQINVTLCHWDPNIDVLHFYVDLLDYTAEGKHISEIAVFLSEIIFWDSSIYRNSNNKVATCKSKIFWGWECKDGFISSPII